MLLLLHFAIHWKIVVRQVDHIVVPTRIFKVVPELSKSFGVKADRAATDYYCSFSIWYHQKERDLIVVGRKTNFRLLWLEWLPFFAFIIKQTENLKFKVSRPKMRSPLCTLRQNCTFCTKLILLRATSIFNFWCKRAKEKKIYIFVFSVFYPSVTSKGIKWKQHWLVIERNHGFGFETKRNQVVSVSTETAWFCETH